jgi:hypothetical protein
MKLLLPILAIILGLIFMGFGARFYFSMAGFKKYALKTTGKVIDVTTNKSKTGGLVYSPVILFTTETGEQIKYFAQRYRNEKYTIGEDIKILYNKENPQQAYLDNKTGVFGGVYFLLAVGIACILLGIYLFTKK